MLPLVFLSATSVGENTRTGVPARLVTVASGPSAESGLVVLRTCALRMAETIGSLPLRTAESGIPRASAAEVRASLSGASTVMGASGSFSSAQSAVSLPPRIALATPESSGCSEMSSQGVLQVSAETTAMVVAAGSGPRRPARGSGRGGPKSAARGWAEVAVFFFGGRI